MRPPPATNPPLPRCSTLRGVYCITLMAAPVNGAATSAPSIPNHKLKTASETTMITGCSPSARTCILGNMMAL